VPLTEQRRVFFNSHLTPISKHSCCMSKHLKLYNYPTLFSTSITSEPEHPPWLKDLPIEAMSSFSSVRLSLLERFQLLYHLPKALAIVATDFLRRTLLSWRIWSTKTAKRNLAASLGSLMTVMPPRYMRYLNPRTTGDVVRQYCASHGLPLESILLEDTDGFPPATLHFIDCKADQRGPMFLYFHGGGYVMPLQSPELAMCEAQAASSSLAILEYTLAPECKYPGQLKQGIAALRLLLQYRSYSEITIGGESAGGNLALALLVHMQKPKTGIVALPERSRDGSTALRAAIAISPRTRNEAVSLSYTTNRWRDFISRESIAFISANWAPLPEVWAAPDMGDAEFWRDVRAQRVLLVAGGDEVYRDDIVHTAKIMGATGEPGAKVEVVICPGEVHIQCGVDLAFGIEDGIMLKAVMSWLGTL
jgi:acetyl esterase/lipase